MFSLLLKERIFIFLLYTAYKNQTCTEKYLFRHMSIKPRSYYAKIRCGTFPINIELWRYRNPKVHSENRLGKVCENPAVEDEKHFLVECSGYNTLRNELFIDLNIHHLSDDEKFKHCLKEADSKTVSNFLIYSFMKKGMLSSLEDKYMYRQIERLNILLNMYNT